MTNIYVLSYFFSLSRALTFSLARFLSLFFSFFLSFRLSVPLCESFSLSLSFSLISLILIKRQRLYRDCEIGARKGLRNNIKGNGILEGKSKKG